MPPPPPPPPGPQHELEVALHQSTFLLPTGDLAHRMCGPWGDRAGQPGGGHHGRRRCGSQHRPSAPNIHTPFCFLFSLNLRINDLPTIPAPVSAATARVRGHRW